MESQAAPSASPMHLFPLHWLEIHSVPVLQVWPGYRLMRAGVGVQKVPEPADRLLRLQKVCLESSGQAPSK